jgi:hypothetical protein
MRPLAQARSAQVLVSTAVELIKGRQKGLLMLVDELLYAPDILASNAAVASKRDVTARIGIRRPHWEPGCALVLLPHPNRSESEDQKHEERLASHSDHVSRTLSAARRQLPSRPRQRRLGSWRSGWRTGWATADALAPVFAVEPMA